MRQSSIANKETFLNKHASTHQGYHPSNQHRGNKIAHFSFLLKEYLLALKSGLPFRFPGDLTWKIPWTEEPGRVKYMGSQRVGHN